MKKTIKVTYAPGCFNEFDGTQEELDNLVKEIQELAESGKLFELATKVTEEIFEKQTDNSKHTLQ